MQIDDLIDLRTGETVAWKHKEGEVTVICFWNTVFPQCQGPMAKCHELITSHYDWNGKVHFVAISADDNRDDVVKYVHSRGWAHEHYWQDREKPNAEIGRAHV